MKIAHLILAHKDPAQLAREVAALDHPAVSFFIHLDKRTDANPFQNIFQQPNVHFIRDRVRVEWGGWGTIQATLNGFREIVSGGFDYINVISGQDFPIKTAADILAWYEQHNGTEFITCDKMGDGWKGVESRIANYHLINWRIPGKFRLERLVNIVLPQRKFPLGYEVVGRANWFSLTARAVEYILTFLKAHPRVVRYFKYCWGADEFIFSTILFNSSFRERIRDNLVYVDWPENHRGHPKILGIADFPALVKSEKLYARKFDSAVDNGILLRLENHFLTSSKQ